MASDGITLMACRSSFSASSTMNQVLEVSSSHTATCQVVSDSTESTHSKEVTSYPYLLRSCTAITTKLTPPRHNPTSFIFESESLDLDFQSVVLF
jgi:hypothetical protein